MVSLGVVACFAVFAVAAATNVQQCPGKSIPNLSDDVQLSPCKKPPCRLKKGTNQNIQIKFTPETDIKAVTNHVTAFIFGVDVPFIGVDGNSICDKIYTEAGERVDCPLKAGTTYLYKDSFPILSVYPSITVKVHWELFEKENKFVCFEVMARIL